MPWITCENTETGEVNCHLLHLDNGGFVTLKHIEGGPEAGMWSSQIYSPGLVKSLPTGLSPEGAQRAALIKLVRDMQGDIAAYRRAYREMYGEEI